MIDKFLKIPLNQRLGLLGVAMALIALIFYFFARFLGDIPDAFHDGTIWE